MRRVLHSLLLAIVYLVMIGSASVLDVAMAMAVAILISAGMVAAPRGARPWSWSRLVAIPWFMVGVAAELARGSWLMLRVLIGTRPWQRIGFVEVSMGERTPIGVIVSQWSVTMAPGSTLVDEDQTRRTILVNVIDAADADAVRADMERFYQRFQRPLVP